MSSEVQEEKKGLLRRPVNIWKLTLPLWLAVMGGCCILSLGIYAISGGGATSTPQPTKAPVAADTEVPTEEPIEEPTEVPAHTEVPTEEPTEVPTDTAVPTEEPTDVPTDTPEPTEDSEGQVMYFCGYDRCKDSGIYGELLTDVLAGFSINVRNTPDRDGGGGGIHHQADHHDQVTVVEHKRVSEGPGGLWYRLEDGGWTNDLWLTEEPCTEENLEQYSFTDCLEGEY